MVAAWWLHGGCMVAAWWLHGGCMMAAWHGASCIRHQTSDIRHHASCIRHQASYQEYLFLFRRIVFYHPFAGEELHVEQHELFCKVYDTPILV
jgi:hypothetical protein